MLFRTERNHSPSHRSAAGPSLSLRERDFESPLPAPSGQQPTPSPSHRCAMGPALSLWERGFYWYVKLIGVSAAGRHERSTAFVGSWKKLRIILRTQGLLRETPWVALVTITTCEPS